MAIPKTPLLHASPPPVEDPDQAFQLAALSLAVAAVATVLDRWENAPTQLYRFSAADLSVIMRAKIVMMTERSRLEGGRA